MVKGLRSPEAMHLDLMHTYNATASQTFLEAAAARLGAVSLCLDEGGDLDLAGRRDCRRAADRRAPASARGCSTGSYYGQTMQIWSALIAAAHVGRAGLCHRRIGAWVNRRMGVREAAGMNGPFLGALAFWLAAWAINIWLPA
jgi:NitT/TauT family transport system permease protein